MKRPFHFHSLAIFAATLLLGFTSVSAHAENGVTDTEILLGVSNSQSGPTEALGKGVTAGLKVYFDKLNAAGGVNGRTVKLNVLDDKYEPADAIANTTKLITEDKVLALIGYVGTPTAKAVVPIVAREKVPFFAPFTGAGFLRTPVLPYVFNVRASYNDEMEAIVTQLADKKGMKKIALFMQNDSYGQAGEAGLKAALEKRQMTVAETGTYERNTVDVAEALTKLKAANPDAVVMVGAYKACAAFMKAAAKDGFKPTFVNISFVGTSALIKEAGAEGEGSFVSQVMPNPFSSDLQIVKDYQADMKAAGQEAAIDYTSLEGYVQAALFAKALEKAGKDLTRDSLLTALNSLDEDIGGLKLKLAADDHQASDTVYLTKVANGKPETVEGF